MLIVKISAVATSIINHNATFSFIGGSDPERMAAPKVEEYVREIFDGTNVKIEVIKGQTMFEKEYPCLGNY